MRFDLVLNAGVPLLALVLLGTSHAEQAAGVRRGARRRPWLLLSVRAAALVGLAGAGALLLWLRTRSPIAPPALEPFALALAFLLMGALVLREGTRAGGEARGVVLLLGEAAAAMVTGAGAAMLAGLSHAPAVSLGILGGPFRVLTIYALSALGGLFVRFALDDATPLHVGLAACAWLSVVRGLAVGADAALVPAMVVLFLVAAGAGAWGRDRHRRRAQAPEKPVL